MKANKYNRGFIREDGMIFWGYNKNCKNGEWWVTADLFEIYKEKRRFYSRDRYAKYTKRVKECSYKWKRNNPEKVKASVLKWRTRNREKYLSTRNEYQKRRRQQPLIIISERIRALIYFILKVRIYTKKSKTYEILGCSYEDFKIYIENHFKDGMTWENKGAWHIDHIIPTCTAKTEEDLIRLNHYTNLQPLWAEENLKKGSKLIAL